jgi:RHS repeat-associated protein
MTAIGSSTPTYDANGNVTNDFLHTYAWDANGRPVTIDGVAVTYDALGRMVEQNKSGTYSEVVYSPTGSKLAIMNGQSLLKGFVNLPGGSAAVYNSSGLAYYRHSDWLGSSRFASTPTRTLYFDGAYAPFGEAYAQTGTLDLSFTGMNQDTVANLYDFPTREYGTQGRWPSPDPAGISSVQLKDPRTWNRYAYARNNPETLVDPNGLCTAPPGGNGVCIDLFIPTEYIPGTGDAGLGDMRGPDGDGGSFRIQFQITFDPSNSTVKVYDELSVSQVDLGGTILESTGDWESKDYNVTPNDDGSVTVDIDASAVNGFAGVPFAPSDPINISISITINPDGSASVDPGGTFSGYPSLEVWNYQPGQFPDQLSNAPAGDISQLGTNNTPIPPGSTDGGCGGCTSSSGSDNDDDDTDTAPLDD